MEWVRVSKWKQGKQEKLKENEITSIDKILIIKEKSKQKLHLKSQCICQTNEILYKQQILSNNKKRDNKCKRNSHDWRTVNIST